jgi:hypothetical protein
MERVPFSLEEIEVLRNAIDISEELIGDRYRISTSDWKRYRYDIQSLCQLAVDEVTDFAFAQILRYTRHPDEKPLASRDGDYFKICLQDHVILNVLRRDPKIRLLPLAAYIVSHELIHVIRFATFVQRYDAAPREREEEERRVHAITYELLKDRKIEGLQEVLAAFSDCRAMETFLTRS